MDNILPYKAKFTTAVTKIDHGEIEEFLSKASAESLKPLFPENISLKDNPDIIGIATSVANCSYANRNGECINNIDGLRVAKNFLYKAIDSNHKQSRIIGSIINVGYATFRTNEILTAEQVSQLNEPYNISVAGVLYKQALSDEFIDSLESSALAISVPEVFSSWELFFSEYDIAVGPTRNLFDARILTDAAEIKEYEKYLQVNKGSGKKDKNFVFRVLKGDLLLPTAIGLTDTPAAFATEVIAIDSNHRGGIQVIANDTTKNITKEQILSVISSEDTSLKNKPMPVKFTKITDINEENLKLAVANDVTSFISEELQKANELWQAKVSEKENLAKDLEAQKAAVATELAATKAEVKTLSDKLAKLEQSEAQRIASETYTQRLAAIDNDYEISADERKVVAKNIQGMSDEQFNPYFEDLKVLFAAKKKGAKTSKMKNDDESCEDEDGGEEEAKAKKKKDKSKASTEDVAAAVEAGTANAKKEGSIPNSSDLTNKTYKDKYAKAFTLGDGIEITHGKKKITLQ